MTPGLHDDVAVVPRRAGRVLLLDAQERLLLFRGGDPAAPERGTWWFTPGGGLEPGEEPAQGAARELQEETGLRVAPERLGPAVHEETSEFDFAGQRFRQSAHFFLLRVDAHHVDTSGFSELEARNVDEHRWWRAEDLRATADVHYPHDLLDVLARVAGGAWC